jgi:hypothetical protein
MIGTFQEGYYIPAYNMIGASVGDSSGGWNHPNASGFYLPTPSATKNAVM